MILDSLTTDLVAAFGHFEEQLKTVRTGRAHPGIVEDIHVDAYGSPMDIKSLASVMVTDAKTLTIDPWDKGLVPAIEKAIREAPMGFNPQSDGKILRIVVPQPTQETRTSMVKLMRGMAEEARIAFRHIRDTAKTSIIEHEKKGEISEDERFRLQEKLDAMIKEFNEKIEGAAQKKEEEIMTV